MAFRLQVSCAAVALCLVVLGSAAFLSPAVPRTAKTGLERAGLEPGRSQAEPGFAGASWGVATAGLALGVHVGLAAALFGRSALRAKENAADAKLFEQVYMDYTT
eukprot:CAMPEP_0170595992 /NCGR_PEP_ID=MMETSP0224-20130122/14864_1 /TAXON_ID=285029 /ORGANISM="Togula jolla, Strain CCCM 725" /LENGTH=104 /DNA_ID=CAMNT_0010920223 /DNA_START=61 /DNA_END=371 /DNA_ORIENTATION=-